jgi:hypothetical protein
MVGSRRRVLLHGQPPREEAPKEEQSRLATVAARRKMLASNARAALSPVINLPAPPTIGSPSPPIVAPLLLPRRAFCSSCRCAPAPPAAAPLLLPCRTSCSSNSAPPSLIWAGSDLAPKRGRVGRRHRRWDPAACRSAVGVGEEGQPPHARSAIV